LSSFSPQKTKKKPRTYSRAGIIREKLGKNKENIARRNRAGALLTGLPQFEYEFVPGINANATNPSTLDGTPSPRPLPQLGGEGGVRGALIIWLHRRGTWTA
jgi:hypothetical protein